VNHALIACISLVLVASACDKPSASPPAKVTAAEAAPAAKPAAQVAKAAPAAKPAAQVAKAKPAAKPAAQVAKAAPAAGTKPAGLMDPSKATETAPDTFKVKFETTKGAFTVQVNRAWAPQGADRFYNLVKIGFFSGVSFFRAISGFMVQFGIHGDPKVGKAWRPARIKDDKVDSKVASNTRGKLTFAMAGPNTRTTQLFISYSDRNSRLDGMGFPPIGEVIDGMNIVDALHTGYGEGAPKGRGPAQGRLQSEGNAYLKAEFPQLDFIKNATLL
jgi:peptidyl-prolyl cis-trans isomerase A (cyclophilin A)